MELKYTHTRLLVRNFGDCFRFYGETLGFAVAWGDAQSIYGEFETGTVRLALFDRQAMAEAIGNAGQPAEAASQDRVTLCFDVANVDEVYQQLQGRGVAFIAEPTDRPDWGVRTAHFRDPAGNLIEISARLEA
jgi:catechol 2,3-dioxygenase-like lactoylglutathione lyase family enzyme